MAYEIEAITPTQSQPAQAPKQEPMQERVFSPFAPKTKPVDGQANTNSGNVVPGAPPAAEESVTLSPQMAALARKEQRSRQREQQLKAREAELASREAKLKGLGELDAKLAAKDYSALEGKVNYDEYTNYLLNKQAATDPQSQKMAALEAEIASVKKQREDDANRRFEAAISQAQFAANQLVETSTEFPNLKHMDLKHGKDTARNAIVEHLRLSTEEGKQLTLEDAAKEVATEWDRRVKKEEDFLRSIGRLPPVEAAKQVPAKQTGIKTLTNNMSVSGDPKPSTKSFQGMSDGERYAEARRRAEAKLQQAK
jgi:hypothetical protein